MKNNITDYPFIVFALSFVVLWGTSQLGARFLKRVPHVTPAERDDFGYALGASLTLLGLIIGFTFSMAIGRYDQRKNLEEEEANAIGTEYLRADLAPDAEANEIRGLLKKYLDQRIRYYTPLDDRQYVETNSQVAQLEGELWEAIKRPALLQPTPISALAVSGMNDVINSEGYTRAAWRNRIPPAAWMLMLAIAICCNILLGLASRTAAPKFRAFLLLVLPTVLSISFLLLADIDSPRGGLIRIVPQNLESLAQSLR